MGGDWSFDEKFLLVCGLGIVLALGLWVVFALAGL